MQICDWPIIPRTIDLKLIGREVDWSPGKTLSEIRVVCLMSGGIDSPVAASLIGRQGAELTLLHMDNSSSDEDSVIDKAEHLARTIRDSIGRTVTFYVAPHYRNQKKIAEACGIGYQCVMCKTLMLKVAKALCMRVGADAIVTGESLGQVASQTLHNIRAEERGLDFPVLRPLIGFDKLEIEAVAKRIGTYGVSIKNAAPCPFVPHKPITMAGVGRMGEECRRIDFEEMIDYALSNMREVPLS